MNRDDIIRMAREAANCLPGYTDKEEDPIGEVLEFYTHFAALVAAHEREQCARVCQDEINRVKPIYSVVAENAMKAIRARGQA